MLATENCYAFTVARITLGAVIFAHGGQKLFGLWGGNGWEGTMGFLTGTMGLPWIIAALVILIESLGAIALILGLGARKNAFLIACVLVGAIATVHWQYGFYGNWMGNQTGEGFEYHLLGLGLALTVMFGGAGALSLDRVIAAKIK